MPPHTLPLTNHFGSKSYEEENIMVRQKKPTETMAFRRIKRLRDGAVKKAEPQVAARMVAKGGYEYIDGGPNEAANAPQTKKFRRFSDSPAAVISLAKVKELEGEGTPYTGPQRLLRTDGVFSERGSDPTVQPKAGRKVVKKSDVPKAKLDFIMKSNVANPARSEFDRGAGVLGDIIAKVRSERKK